MVNWIMFWVSDINDLSTIRKLGCDGVHHPTFDGMTPAQQIAWMAKCEGLGLQVGWSALGGTQYAKDHREETINRWKDSPLVSHVIIIGDAQGVPVQDQIDKYDIYKAWAPDILFGIDREFWFESNGDFYSEDAFDILFPYSYPYQTAHSVDTCYQNLIDSMTFIISGTFPIVPLIQCFYNGSTYNPREEFEPEDPEYSDNYMKYQYDRLEALLDPEGWWYDSIGFYPWSAGYADDIKRNPVMQTEVALLIKYRPLSQPTFL